MYYGQLQEILKFKYLLFKVVLFRVKWFDTRNQGRKVKRLVFRNNMTQIDTRAESFKDDQYILVTQVKQVFYLKDKAKSYRGSSNILNELDNVALHIDGQSTEVDVPLNIIDVVDEDDDITDDEDALPYDLADSDNEDLINVYDDGKGKQKPNLGSGEAEYPRQGPKPFLKGNHGYERPRTLPEPHKIGKTGQRARSYLDRDPGRLLAFKMRWQTSTTQEYPSLIDTFFVAHTVNWEFLQDEDLRIYEMRRLEATGTYTDDEINRLAIGGKHRGHIPGMGRYSYMFSQFESGGANGSVGCGDDEEGADHQNHEDEDGDGDT
nr:hypothetical protein [Tanacetum cinerariifolium]